MSTKNAFLGVILSERSESKNLRKSETAEQTFGAKIFRLRATHSAQDDAFKKGWDNKKATISVSL